MANYNQAPLRTTPNTKYYNDNYTSNSVLDKALGQWPYILGSLGIDPSYLKNKHGACPVCGGKDRFRFDDKEGRGTFYCNQCGSGTGIKLLQNFHQWNFLEAIDMVAKILSISCAHDYMSNTVIISRYLNKKAIPPQPAQQKDINTRCKFLNNIWSQAKPISLSDPVDLYLKARGITLTEFPAVLRFHPQLPYYNDDRKLKGKFPALLALAQDKENHAVTLHRTYLGNGCKAKVLKPKKLMSPILPGASSGAAIKLYEPRDNRLALAEGIETALAFSVATKLPAWATISAVGMENILLPPYIKEVIIAVDNDKSGCGQQAASRLAKRLLIEGRAVKRATPPSVGSDFADMLLEDY